MSLLDKSDEEIIKIADPIWNNLVKSSNIKDYGGFTRDFSSQMLYGANEVELGKQWASNELLSSLSERLELSKSNCEPVVFTQYLEGEEYKPHFDAFIKPSNENQRTHTAILYLSKCIGGETFFDNLNITITPSIGDVCFFENCLANTDYINPGSLHSGLKVLEGTKYIMTFWFRRNIF